MAAASRSWRRQRRRREVLVSERTEATEPRAVARGFSHSRRRDGAGGEQSEGDVGCGGPEEGSRAHPGRGGRVPPPLVHGPRGPPEELRRHPGRDRRGLERRHGVRRLVDHGVQRDRGVGHGRDPRSRDLPADAVARRICDVVTPDGEPYDGDPRYVLRRALERMKSMGFDTFNVGPELEYFLFRDDKGTETLDEGGYFAMTAGFHATFMPKPIFGENGSGMHTHQSLFANGRNAFFDADDRWHLSEAGKAFIAGQLRHAREIAAVFAQWINSYKRLVPGYEAPVYTAWSQRNRSALIRIPVYKPGSEQATRAEIRCPDPACNPYLTFAALLHAGLEGIEQGYELPEPMETNLYHLTPEQRRERGITSLPETLGEAIDELSRSDLARKALGKHIFERYVELKRKEWEEYRVQLTKWELERYLPVL